jgi:hypothetical protein
MITTNTLQKPKLAAHAIQVTQLDEAAETIRDDALALARTRLGLVERDLPLNELLQRPDFVGHFTYALTNAVAQALAAHDQRVMEIYTFDLSANPAPEGGEPETPDNTVHLLALVTAPSAALQAFVAALDRALTASLRELAAGPFASRESVLDVNLITEADVRLGLSLAGMLSAVFAPPIKVWQRAR